MFDELPARFGPFVITQRLGSGSCGEVVRATDGRHRRVVALKIPKFHKDDTNARLRFEREARIGLSLQHPQLCAIHEVGEIDGIPYLAMRFIEGETLEKRVPEGFALPVGQATELVWILASAVAAMHSKGVLHRDLKPSNVVFDGNSAPVIVDFGLARALDPKDNLTRAGVMLGTPYYMPPEMVLGEEPDPRSDIYSLGVMLYRLIAGRPPFEMPSLFTKILTHPPVDLREYRDDLNPLLDAIVRKALAKKLEDRFGTMEQFATVLEHYLEGRYADAQALVDTRSNRTVDTFRGLRVPPATFIPTPVAVSIPVPEAIRPEPDPAPTEQRGKDSTVEPARTVAAPPPPPPRPHVPTQHDVNLKPRNPSQPEVALPPAPDPVQPSVLDPSDIRTLDPSYLRRQAEQAEAKAYARFLTEAAPEILRARLCQEPFDRELRRAYLERRTRLLAEFDEADVPAEAVSRQVMYGALGPGALGFAIGALAVGLYILVASETPNPDLAAAAVTVVGCGIVAGSIAAVIGAFVLARSARSDWGSLGPLPPGAYAGSLSSAQQFYLPDEFE